MGTVDSISHRRVQHLPATRADAVFELVDALAGDTQARSPVELSLSPFFRRQYASIYDGLDEVLLGILPPLGEGSFRLWLWTRPRVPVGMRPRWQTGASCTTQTLSETTSPSQ